MAENKISEEYRKYLISFTLLGEEYFTVWGTDLEDNEIDKLIVNEKGEMIFSTDFESLKDYLLSNTQLLFDKSNFLNWLKKSEKTRPYATYDLDYVETLIDLNQFFFKGEYRELLIEVFNLLNLTSDIAYQNNDKELLEIIENQNTQIFIDYIYTVYFWNSSKDQILAIEARVRKEFESKLFIEQLRKLLDYFRRIIPLVLG